MAYQTVVEDANEGASHALTPLIPPVMRVRVLDLGFCQNPPLPVRPFRCFAAILESDLKTLRRWNTNNKTSR